MFVANVIIRYLVKYELFPDENEISGDKNRAIICVPRNILIIVIFGRTLLNFNTRALLEYIRVDVWIKKIL